MNAKFLVLACSSIALAAAAPAARAVDGPLSAYSLHVDQGLGKTVLAAAERMPEEGYAYRPTDSVRTFGKILGHIADAQYLFCSVALGEKNPAPKVEETKSTKADLIAALDAAFKYCERAYEGITDATGAQTVAFMGSQAPKLGVLQVNQVHTVEHYGNLVTYLRMKGIVPPTSDPEFMKTMR